MKKPVFQSRAVGKVFYHANASRHRFHAAVLPLRENKVICEGCDKIVKIGNWPIGKRAKCPKTKNRPYKGKRFS